MCEEKSEELKLLEKELKDQSLTEEMEKQLREAEAKIVSLENQKCKLEFKFKR